MGTLIGAVLGYASWRPAPDRMDTRGHLRARAHARRLPVGNALRPCVLDRYPPDVDIPRAATGVLPARQSLRVGFASLPERDLETVTY